MKLYNSNGSPNALRSRAVIHQLGLEVEIVNVDFASRENRSPEFLTLNPNGKVPTLVDGDLVLWESRAINAYLAGKMPEAGLYPIALDRRAIVDQWSYWQAIHLGPAMQKVAFERVQKKAFGRGEPDESAIAGDVKTAAELLGVLDGALAGREWIAGALSLADFALATTFILRRAAKLGVEAHANVMAWIERVEALPAWEKAIAPVREVNAARGIVLG
ncbi:MAG TPA: glutathione S-transferase family protein [Devosia sp.]|nr:glutathione S-transferase family protein [Devosia sp.]